MQFPLTFPITFGKTVVLTGKNPMKFPLTFPIIFGNSSVSFNVIKGVTPTVTKDLNIVETASGTVAIDKGRVSNSIILHGTQYTHGYSNMQRLNDFMDDQDEVELLYMEDDNHDGDYFIQNLHFTASPGYPTNMYDFDIELQRVRD